MGFAMREAGAVEVQWRCRLSELALNMVPKQPEENANAWPHDGVFSSFRYSAYALTERQRSITATIGGFRAHEEAWEQNKL